MKIRHPQSLALALTLLVLFLSVQGSARTASQTRSGCSRIDQGRAAHFISYEGVSYSDVRLTLHNNSDCPIIVETDDHEAFVLRREKNLALHYLLQDRERMLPGYGWGDSVFNVEISSGDSVFFRVPLARIKKRLAVAVPFKYKWEGQHVSAGAVGGVKHLVYFLLDEVPQEVLRRK